MSNKKSREDLIDHRLDSFNASAALEGKELSEADLGEIKEMLKSGMSPEECMEKVLGKYKNNE